jgi:glucose-1-phosphate thymidylyltransferase
MIGIIPAAGAGTRIQPLACSKELLPVGDRDGRPKAVSEYLVDRMVLAGASRICFVISPTKSDIPIYYGDSAGGAATFYAIQPQPSGLCDALFRVEPLVLTDEPVLVGLPDTVWFPEDGFAHLDARGLSFLLFPVDHPEYFDAVVTDRDGFVEEIQVKSASARTRWIWGAFRMSESTFRELHALWWERGRRDEYFGTLVNAYLARGHRARGVRVGRTYVDVGTLEGYRRAIQLLGPAANHTADSFWLGEDEGRM